MSSTSVPDATAARAAVAVLGVRVAPPVRRRSGAGPSDDGHLRLDGRAAAVPIDPSSPFEIRDGQLLHGGDATGLAAEPVARPRFYDGRTVDGIAYEQLARLHGDGVLATTVIQTCVRYDEPTRCRFCAIEASLDTGATTRVKTPQQLAEVADAAVRLDGVHQMVLTTGTTATADRGARYLARCVRAIRAAVPGLLIQVQCEPPADLTALAELADAGATAIGIHIESLDEDVRRRWMPGKATVARAAYDVAWDEAVRLFGRNRVSTYLLVGLGEDPDELVAGAVDLVDRGVYPFIVPFRPLAGTLAADHPPPDPGVLASVTTQVATALRAAGMSGAEQGAGCAACGACSALAQAGG
jgi:radical SAM protein (TIGR04043 family)